MRNCILILLIWPLFWSCSPHLRWSETDNAPARPTAQWLSVHLLNSDSVFADSAVVRVRGRNFELNRSIHLDPSGAFYVDSIQGNCRGGTLSGSRHYNLAGEIIWRWTGVSKKRTDLLSVEKAWTQSGIVYGEKFYITGEVLLKEVKGRYQKQVTIVYSPTGKRATVAVDRYNLKR